jgi:O-antigen/teichoic acid export membrane protein
MSAKNKIRYFSASSLLFVARAFGAMAMFGAQILMARMISADALALFFLSTSMATVAGTAAALGYPNIMAAILGRYHHPRHAERANAFVSLSRSEALWTGSLLGLVLAVFIAVYPGMPWAERVCFWVAIPSIPALALLRTNSAFALVRDRLSTAYLAIILWRPVIFLCLSMYAVLVLHLEDAAVFTGLFAAIAIAWTLLQAYELHGEAKPPSGKADRRLTRHWRRGALPFVVISMVGVLIIDLDTLLAGTMLPRKELAIYGVCLKLAFFGGFIVDVLRDLIAPELARCYARRDFAAMRKNIAITNFAAVAGMLAIMAGAMLFGRTMLGAFGSDFVAGKYTLLTLVVVQLVNALGGPHIALLTQKGAQRRIVYAYIAAAVVLAVLNAWLAPLFGLLGAALAVLAAFIVLNVILAANVWLLLGIRSDALTVAQFRFARRPSELPHAVG